MNYDFELGRIAKEAKKSGARIVGLQFPDGLKTDAVDVARRIEKKTKSITIIFADPCYGACDTKEAEAKKLGAGLVFQFGHDPF